MGERYLIINADDFGICESADRAILQLFQEGLITSTSLMVPAPLAGQAADAAAEKKLAVGVHWTLHSDFAYSRWHSAAPAKEVASLRDEQGLFADAGLMAKQAKSAEVTRELTAQVAFMQQHGCPPDHADSHGGTLYGMNGRLFFINAFRLCRRYRLPFRMPRRGVFLDRQFRGQVPGVVRVAHRAIVGLANIMGVALIDDMITNPLPVKDINGYEDLRNFYLRQVNNMGEGITELFLHPAYADPEISRYTPEWQKREWELQFLLSGDLQELAAREGIKLVSWREAFSQNKHVHPNR